MSNQQIYNGLKFTSTNFAMTAEVKEVRLKENEVDVILTPSDGHAWVEKNWNLEHVKWGFERGEYKLAEMGPNYSVY